MESKVLNNVIANNNVEIAASEDVAVPCNIEAEYAVLGAILNNNENLNQVGDFLRPEHFYVPLNRQIFESILKFYEKGLIATPITLKSHFDRQLIEEICGKSPLDYLLEMVESSATMMMLVPYAKAIYETALKRELIRLSEVTIEESHEKNIDYDAQGILERAEQRLFNLASNGDTDKKVVSLRDSVIESIKRIDHARKSGQSILGVETGYVDLDKILGGLQPSDLLILAARPSMGKTALAMNLAMNAARIFQKEKKPKEKPKGVAIFSLEMSADQIANRLISIETGIDASKIRTGTISKTDFDTLLAKTKELADLPIFIDDTPAISISALRTRARRMKRQYDISLIVVDYLQLVRGSTINMANRVQEIGEISQGLKAIAKELNIPVMALSQLSRAVETREDKRPQLSDLRESGNIEQDADVVMFIYREEYYLSRKMPPAQDHEKFQKWQDDMEKVRNLTEIHIAKQRNGPIGSLALVYDSRTTGFANLDARNNMEIYAG